MSFYRAKPVEYSRKKLKATLTDQQVGPLEALLTPPYRVLVPSANTVGKTYMLGCGINWHHDTHDPGIVLATSSTYRQVKTQLFKEVRRLRPRGRGLKPQSPEIFHHPLHFVIGYSSSKPDAFQGHHECALMLVFDEATGIPTTIADRAETMFSGVPGHAWICTYNPNDPTTWPYAAEQSGGWAVKRLSALEHPNIAAELAGLPPPFPGAVRLHRIMERIRRECEDCGDTPHDETCFQFPPPNLARAGEIKPPFDRPRWWKPVKPEFDPQVRGRWPQQAMNSIWTEADRKRCSERVTVDPLWPVQIGCDVARHGGNRTTFSVRKGTAIVHLEERTHWPTRRVSAHIADHLRQLCHEYQGPKQPERSIPCLVDDTGGYGAGVTDYPGGYNFIGVNAATQASDPKMFPNRRSELWFRTRLAADEGGFFTGSVRVGAELVDTLWQELTASRYSLDSKNRRVVEGKDAVSARLRRSPDLADAVNLSWFPVG